MLKKFVLIAFLFVSIVAAAVIFYPQTYCCQKITSISQYHIYYCGSEGIDAQQYKVANIQAIIDKAHKLVQKSELFDPTLTIKIFIQGKDNICKSFPFQFQPLASAQTIAVINNIFLSDANFITNSSNKNGYARSLSATISHEVMHVMFENTLGWYKTRLKSWSNNNSRTELGIFWKEEGYADYIAGDKVLLTNKQLENLKNTIQDPYAMEYLKSWVAIKYLLEIEHLNISEIVDLDLKLDEVFNNARAYYRNKIR